MLSADTPQSEEYWANILENTNREKLSAYEIAHAAKMMRDRFKVTGHAFAQKTGHSPDYVNKLLACIDRLPVEVLNSWRRGDRVPFEIYYKLSCMTPLEAIKNLRLWMGQHRIDSSGAQRRRRLSENCASGRRVPDKLLTVRGVERTQPAPHGRQGEQGVERAGEVPVPRCGRILPGQPQASRRRHRRLRPLRDVVFEPPERPDVDDVALMTVLPSSRRSDPSSTPPR